MTISIAAGNGIPPAPRLLPATQQAAAGSAAVQVGPGKGREGQRLRQTWVQCHSCHQVAIEHRSSSLPASQH